MSEFCILECFDQLDRKELKAILVEAEGSESEKKKIRRLSTPRLKKHFIKCLSRAANLASENTKKEEIFRESLEKLMKELKVPFTKNLDDKALFNLFRRHLSEQILKYVEPMMRAGFFMALCDDDFHADEKRTLEFFIKNLDLHELSKKEFLIKFFPAAKKEYNKAKGDHNALAKIISEQSKDDQYGKSILRFCYALALVEGGEKRQELIFYNSLAREMKIDFSDVHNIRYEVDKEFARQQSLKELGEGLGCPNINGNVLNTVVSGIGTNILKDAGVLFLFGLIGWALYRSYLFFWGCDPEKIACLLIPLAQKAEEELKEERIEEIRNVFEKLSRETAEMLKHCKNIQFYLKNSHKAYSEVSDSAWLKGLLGQMTASGRKKLLAGGTLLEEVLHEVQKLFNKIVEHQSTLSSAIDEHLRIIWLSSELKKSLRKISLQNQKLTDKIKAATPELVTAQR